MTLCTYLKTRDGCAVLGADSFAGDDYHFRQSEKIHRYGHVYLMEAGDESHIESIKRRIRRRLTEAGSVDNLLVYLESWNKKYKKRAFLKDAFFILSFSEGGDGIYYCPEEDDIRKIESYQTIGIGKESADIVLNLFYRANSWRKNPPSTADAVKATLYSFYASIGRDTAVKPPVKIIVTSKEPKEFLIDETTKTWRKVVKEARGRFTFRNNGNGLNVLELLEGSAGQL